MWTASVDADSGERLIVRVDDGWIAGKRLLSFQTALDLYCLQQADDAVRQWFGLLDTQLQGELCRHAQPLLDAIYSGNWDYLEDEYEFFKLRARGYPVTEDEFKQGLARAKSAWTDAASLLVDVRTILNGIQSVQLNEVGWYDAIGTLGELKALAETIALLVSRDARKVRINIE